MDQMFLRNLPNDLLKIFFINLSYFPTRVLAVPGSSTCLPVLSRGLTDLASSSELSGQRALGRTAVPDNGSVVRGSLPALVSPWSLSLHRKLHSSATVAVDGPVDSNSNAGSRPQAADNGQETTDNSNRM